MYDMESDANFWTKIKPIYINLRIRFGLVLLPLVAIMNVQKPISAMTLVKR